MTFTTDVDSFHVAEREVYWLCRTEQSDSTFSGAVLEKTLDVPATLRNSRTVKRIVEKFG